MRCPYCEGDSRVLDSRPSPDGVRRRRECDACRRRFTTYERRGPAEIRVVKAHDHRGQDFDPAKIAATVMRVSKGLPVSRADAERIAREIEAELLDHGRTVVASGDLVQALLRRLEGLHRRAAARFEANYLDADGHLVLDTHRTESPVEQRTLFGPE